MVIGGCPSVGRSLVLLTAAAIIGQGTGENEIKPLKLSADCLSDDAIDRRIEGLASLVAAERAQALNQDGVEPYRDRLLRGIFGAHLMILAQSGRHRQDEWRCCAGLLDLLCKPSKPDC